MPARRGCWSRRGWGFGVLLAASVDGVLLAASVGRTLSPSAYVVVLLRSDFHGLLLLAPVRGGTSFLFKREKKRSKETRFTPPIFKRRRRSLQVFGTNVARPSPINGLSNTHLARKPRAHASPLRPHRDNFPCSATTQASDPHSFHPPALCATHTTQTN